MIAYDKHNVSEYNIRGNQGRYICSLCGGITTLSDSVSFKGYNLVCNQCRYRIKRVLDIDDEILKIQAAGEARWRKEEKGDNT